jgi:rhamnulokinase
VTTDPAPADHMPAGRAPADSAPDASLIAIDLGASSGRVARGELRGGELHVDVVHRFANAPVEVEGRHYWNVLGLWRELLEGLRAAAAGGPADAIGVDSWAVDYALLDRNGHLLDGVRCYRDPRTDGVMEHAFQTMPRDELYRRTGIQFLPFNTLYQLLAVKRDAPELLDTAEHLLMLPDLLHAWLTGVRSGEPTNASTTQLFDPQSNDWDTDLIETLGLPRRIFPELRPAGSTLGRLSPAVADATGLDDARVVLPGTHDTASAVAAVPASDTSDWAYISSGTWSLVGVETREPFLGEDARHANLTNEVGVDGTIRLLKNVMGLWVVQQCQRAWNMEIGEVLEVVPSAPAFAALIDPDDARFLPPGTDMPHRVQSFCRETGQRVPESPAEIARCVLESLALAYAKVLDDLERVTGNELRTVHIVGGGSQNALLSQWTADATGRRVVCGPVEATLLGNLLTQAVGIGVLARDAVRDVVRASSTLTEHLPAQAGWDEAAERFAALLGATR